MSDLDLGALSAQLKLQMDGLDASVRKAVARLDDLEAASNKAEKKTEDLGKTLKNALKGEVLINAVNRLASSVGQISPEFERASKSIQGAGAVLQGFFQGGIVGAGIAGLGVFTASVAEDFREIQKLADAADKATQRSLDTMAAGYAKVADSLSEVTKKLEAVNDAKKYGITLSEAEFKIRAQEITNAIGSLRINAARSTALADQVGSGYDGGFREAAAAANREADMKAEQLKLLESTVRLDKATKDAARPMSDFAKALKEARAYSPETMLAGQRMSPGQMARALADFGRGTTTEPGSISAERTDRAARNAEYRANASQVVTPANDAARAASGAPSAFSSNADMVTDAILADLEGLSVDLADFGVGVDDLVQTLGQVAPKSAALASAIATATSPQEAIAKVVLQLAAMTPEFQYLGQQMDGFVQTLSKVVGAILRPFVPVLTEVLNLAGVLVDFALALDKVNPMGDVLKIALSELFEVLNVLTASLAALAVGIEWVAGNIKNAIVDAATAVLTFANLGGVFNGVIADLAKMKVDVVKDVGAAMGDAFKKESDRTAEDVFKGVDALGGLADAANKVAQSFLNLPAGFKVAAAVFDASQASSDMWGGYTPPAGSAASMPSVAATAPTTGSGAIYNFYAPIYVNGDGSFEANVGRGAPQMPPPNQPTAYPPTP